ncbi:MAG TPA: RnfABCDGE type electron transport complex subunit D [Tepidisphaeraceae bacterium]|nr:RnfABCDGE type electron transport complex subunit D [Tepidisphaeraceae bacterium]
MTDASSDASVSQAPPLPRAARVPSGLARTGGSEMLLHSGVDLPRFFALHALGAVFPLTAGILLFGWRALGAVALVVGSAAVAWRCWKRIGMRGGQLHLIHCLWFAVLLAMTLPAHLFSGGMRLAPDTDGSAGAMLWPVLVVAGAVLVIFMWLLGGLGSGRVHPVLVTHLLLFVCFADLLTPQYVLQRGSIFFGDLLDAVPGDSRQPISQPWVDAPQIPGHSAIRREPASRQLATFTTGATSLNRTWVSLDSLLRDRMPPLEDLLVGGHPAAIGSGSAIAAIIGGLFLLYRGVIDYRVPLLIFIGAIVAMLLLPVPVLINETDVVRRWLPMRVKGVGWELSLTLVNYELMASPLAFTAFFLATWPAVRPITRRGRTVYALLAGVFSGAYQLYVSVSIGPYLGLLTASLLTPALDKVFRSRTLV